jgi:hypothetical protein
MSSRLRNIERGREKAERSTLRCDHCGRRRRPEDVQDVGLHRYVCVREDACVKRATPPEDHQP